MTKTKEELTQLKTEYETLNNKLKELSEDELSIVTGGNNLFVPGYKGIPCPITLPFGKDGVPTKSGMHELNNIKIDPKYKPIGIIANGLKEK